MGARPTTKPPTPYQAELLARVERFADTDGYDLMRRVEANDDRNCIGIPVDIFFPGGEESRTPSTKVAEERAKIAGKCAGCPVADECLAGALQRAELYGSWGGVCQSDFQALLRQWRAARVGRVEEDLDRRDCPAKVHGTRTAYSTHGCRCPDAREAHRVACKARRQELRYRATNRSGAA